MVQLTPEAAARHDEAERQPLPLQEAKAWMSNKEREDGNMLAEITGADFDRALRILRRHDGDMEKAANSLLNGAEVEETAADRARERELAEVKESFAHLFPDPPKSKPETPNVVIDLTGDDDDAPTTTRFRATTRSPDPAWQMTIATPNNKKSEEEQLKEVMEASWADFTADESDEMRPEDTGLREGGRPIALRADMPTKAYAALIIHALFHVPQVRQRVSKLHLHLIDGAPPLVNPDWALWALIEMFTALDIGRINVYLDEELLTAWEAPQLGAGDEVGRASKVFLERVTNTVQKELDAQQVEVGSTTTKLFHFTHCSVHVPATGSPERVDEQDVGFVVEVQVGGTHNSVANNTDSAPVCGPATKDGVNPTLGNGANSTHGDSGKSSNVANDLTTRLSQTLNSYAPDGSSTHQLIQRASEVVAFEIVVAPSFSSFSNTTSNIDAGKSGNAASPEPLAFPATLHMDQFLDANLDLANETRAAEGVVRREMGVLASRRGVLVGFEGQDTLGNLRGAIEYYEHVAACDSPERLATLRRMAGKLRNVLAKMEGEVREIDAKLASLQRELDGLWENPELKCHPYDLRAVLVHTGLPGRKGIYSYVRDSATGTWWKTVDYTVTEVSEDQVLADPAGLHLGAGPYMLLYSRRQSEAEAGEPVQWPPIFVDRVENNNAMVLEGVRPQIEIPVPVGVGAAREGAAMDLS
ncbi:hypothetical protein B0H14DRAFT_2696359 [Mycena olivaceomarginata]|nr:hypothetical protein B0H14DRAFT_2696359 [Mycena olivaceomarginata]